MTRPIADTGYWKERLADAQRGHLHHAVYRCPLEQWQRIEAKHREIIAKHIKPWESVVDCGCGYGRLPAMLPKEWGGGYLGIDFSPELIDVARERNPGFIFIICNLLDLSIIRKRFDWAVLTSIRPMIIRELGNETWDKMEQQIRRIANKILYLEYDFDCNGYIE